MEGAVDGKEVGAGESKLIGALQGVYITMAVD